MTAWFGRLQSALRRSGDTRASMVSLVLKAGSLGVVFLYGIVLARLLGPSEYGAYEYAFAWLTLLLVPSLFGLDKVAIRILAECRARSRWGEGKALLRWGTLAVVVASIVVGAIAAFVAWRVSIDASVAPWTIWIVCATLPASALALFWEGALRGLHHVVVGQLPVLIVRPVVALVLLVVAIPVVGLPANATTALITFFGAAIAAAASAGRALEARIPSALRAAVSEAKPGDWLAAAAPLAVMAALYLVNGRLGILVLGSTGRTEEAGIFALVVRGSDLVLVAMMAVNAAMSPTFASLHARGESRALQHAVTRATATMFLIALPLAVGLFAFAPQFLGIFGAEFKIGAPALRVMLGGQVLNIAMGSVGVLLVMTGNERASLMGFSSGALVNIVLAFTLIPLMGLMGAAVAATASVVVWNLVLGIATWRRLRVDATVFGPVARWVLSRVGLR